MELFFDDAYKGFGHSEGLARGLQLQVDGKDLTQEGMGLGTVAIKYGRRTVFSRNYSTKIDKEPGSGAEIIVRTYKLDTILLTGFKGKHSEIWTKQRDAFIEAYKKHFKSQNFQLSIDRNFRKLFKIERVFSEIDPIGEAKITYKFDKSDSLKNKGTKVEVEVAFTLNEANSFNFSKICIMNEMGADWFKESIKNDKRGKPPSAWEIFDPRDYNAGLYDNEHKLKFSIKDVSVSEGLEYKIYWGREKTSELCWAGFTIEIETNKTKLTTNQIGNCKYTIHCKIKRF